MATFNKFNSFIEEIFEGGHNLGSDTLKVCLTDTAPDATQTALDTGVDHPPPANANGYTAGGNTITISSSAQTGGTYKLVLADSVFTATAGGIGPFRYAILYNSSKSNKLIGWFDYTESITVDGGDTFTVDFHPDNGIIQAS